MIGSATGDDEQTANVVGVEIELFKTMPGGSLLMRPRKVSVKIFGVSKSTLCHKVACGQLFSADEYSA